MTNTSDGGESTTLSTEAAPSPVSSPSASAEAAGTASETSAAGKKRTKATRTSSTRRSRTKKASEPEAAHTADAAEAAGDKAATAAPVQNASGLSSALPSLSTLAAAAAAAVKTSQAPRAVRRTKQPAQVQKNSPSQADLVAALNALFSSTAVPVPAPTPASAPTPVPKQERAQVSPARQEAPSKAPLIPAVPNPKPEVKTEEPGNAPEAAAHAEISGGKNSQEAPQHQMSEGRRRDRHNRRRDRDREKAQNRHLRAEQAQARRNAELPQTNKALHRQDAPLTPMEAPLTESHSPLTRPEDNQTQAARVQASPAAPDAPMPEIQRDAVSTNPLPHANPQQHFKNGQNGQNFADALRDRPGKNSRRHRRNKNRHRNRLKRKNRDQVIVTLRKLFHIDHFRPHQREVIDRVLLDKDTLAVLPTGSGKSLTYQMATVISALRDEQDGRPLTIVVSPLIALMRDQHEKLCQYQERAIDELLRSQDSEKEKYLDMARRGFDGVRFDSTATPKQREKILQEIEAGQHSILLITPESLSDAAILARIRTRNVALFVIDEAHCVSKWGHDFRPSYLALKQIVERLGRPAILALTATATPGVQEDIIEQLGMNVDDLPTEDDAADEDRQGESDEAPKSDQAEAAEPAAPAAPQASGTDAPAAKESAAATEGETGDEIHRARPGIITTPPNRPNLSFRVEIHSDERGKLRSLLQHVRENQGRAGIIYCATIEAVEMVYVLLQKANLSAAYYHGQLSKKERDLQHSRFMNPGSNQVVMAATNAFGLGVDKKNTRYVIHYQMPGSMEAYVQEAGRAGRDGKPAQCILLYDEHDMEVQEFFIDQQYPDWGQMKRVARALYAWVWRERAAHRKEADLAQKQLAEAAGEGSAESALSAEASQNRAARRAAADGSVNLPNLALAANVPQKRTLVALRRLIELGLAEEVLPDDDEEDDKDEKTEAELTASESSPAPAASPSASSAVQERRWVGIRDDVETEEQLFREMDNCARIYDQQRMHDKRRLRELEHYAHSTECRSRFIQRYFGVPEDQLQQPCGCCDNDLSPEEREKLEKALKETVETSPVFKDKKQKAQGRKSKGDRGDRKDWGKGRGGKDRRRDGKFSQHDHRGESFGAHGFRGQGQPDGHRRGAFGGMDKHGGAQQFPGKQTQLAASQTPQPKEGLTATERLKSAVDGKVRVFTPQTSQMRREMQAEARRQKKLAAEAAAQQAEAQAEKMTSEEAAQVNSNAAPAPVSHQTASVAEAEAASAPVNAEKHEAKAPVEFSKANQPKTSDEAEKNGAADKAPAAASAVTAPEKSGAPGEQSAEEKPQKKRRAAAAGKSEKTSEAASKRPQKRAAGTKTATAAKSAKSAKSTKADADAATSVTAASAAPAAPAADADTARSAEMMRSLLALMARGGTSD